MGCNKQTTYKKVVTDIESKVKKKPGVCRVEGL